MSLARQREIYYNPKQIQFLQSPAKRKFVLAGRGWGKSTAISGGTYQQAAALPQGKIFFASTTYAQILTKTLPPVEEKWNEIGLREHKSNRAGHYVIGKRPPTFWPLPHRPPRDFKNVISFRNGFCIELLSMDRKDLARGGSYDGGHIDEAALLHEDMLTKVIMPMVRGNRHRFGHSPQHGMVSLYTSVPWLSRGQWIYKYEKLAQEFPGQYLWLEGTAYDNIDVLGEEYIEMLRRELPDLEFRIEVMNERIQRSTEAFYHAYDDNVHLYEPTVLYSEGARGIEVDRIVDVRSNEMLDISLDFGGYFSGLLVFQYNHNEKTEYCRDTLYVKAGSSVDDLAKLFMERYKLHKNKFVRIWGEPMGHAKQAATGMSMFHQLELCLRRGGWNVEVAAKATPPRDHIDRYGFINDILQEDKPGLPRLRINMHTCKALAIAIATTSVLPNFKKDKSAERDRTFPQEHAPHLTDCMDYFFEQKYIDIKTARLGQSGGGHWTATI